ncbi:MAG: murein biosynthesis integral membrane protein MurJ [Dethiobacter sp.]|nr:murein biosynthesis integral membrane protein MurJ [Dethiobacter sp.]
MSSRAIFKWTGIVAVLLVFSRLLGFLREAAIAYRFGASAETDAYMAAVILPQLLFLSFNDSIKTAFIPVYGECHRERAGQSLALTSYVIFTVILTLLSMALVVAAPLVVRLVAPGFSGEKYESTVVMARILLPGLLFLGLSGISSGVLHTKRNFVIPAIPAYASNLIIIGTALFLGMRYGIIGLAWGTTVGFASQFLIQLPAVARHGIFQGKLDLRHPGLRKMALVLPPILLGGAAIEIKTLVDRMFGSFLPDGSLTALSFAGRIYLLPNGIIVLALLTVIYPTLVELNVERKMAEFKTILRQGAGLIILLILPIMVGMLLLREPVVRLIFERGEFDVLATAKTASALAFYSIGLLPLGIMLLSKRAFFALQDTRTPMLAMVFTGLLNIFFNWLLIKPLGLGGIALGTSLAVYAGAAGLLLLLRLKIGAFAGRQLWLTLQKSSLAALLMGVVVLLGSNLLTDGGFVRQALELGVLISLGAAVYLLAAYLLRVEELAVCLKILRRKVKK